MALDVASCTSINDLQASRIKAAGDESSFLQKRKQFTVIYDEQDLTPDDIVDPDFAVFDKAHKQAAFEMSRTRDETKIKVEMSKSRMALALAASTLKVFATTINLDEIYINHTLNTAEGIVDDSQDLERAPSAFYLPKIYPLTTHLKEANITLKETPICFLFDLPSISFEKGTSAATSVEEENTFYEYITVGKGRNRKMVVEETQTESVITQTRHTLAVKPDKKNAMAFASMWDMHDTYSRITDDAVQVDDEMVLYQSAAQSMLRKKKKKETLSQQKVSKTFKDIGSMPQFLDAALVTERVLASLEYGEAQKVFRGLQQMDPLSLDLIYVYTLNKLWTFEYPETENRPIISVSFNPKNGNILAAAHGKFPYAENITGMVCVWCSKSPTKPERLYRFECPVTSVSFSEKNPNWLACGFWNGDVIILDITSHSIKIIASSKRDTNPCFEPIWVTNWRTIENLECLMAGCQDGRINRFTSTKTLEFLCSPMMRVSTVEGKLKGIEITKTCLKMDVPITRYPAVLCMQWHPEISHIYYVGTDEGCVHKCSTHYLNQHIEVFRGHTGPVYGIEICPFYEQLYVTCGADNAIRLWIENLDEMIMTLTCPAAVQGAVFCPKNATILVSISGNVILIWDLRRKIHEPCAQYIFHDPGVVLTCVNFSPSGDNLFVCDTLGRIHTFHLEDTPIPPYDQRAMVDQAIRDALCTRPHLLKQIEKLERLVKA